MSLVKVHCSNSGCPWNDGYGRCAAEEIYVDCTGQCREIDDFE